MSKPPLRLVPDPSAFEALVETIDFPMYIVTANNGTEMSGCLVGFAAQASINPPRLVAMISKKNHTFRIAENSASLAVHYLGVDNAELATLFGEETGDEVDKFASCTWSPGLDNLPILEGVRGWVAGPVRAHVDSGDHVAMFVNVAASHVEPDAGPPLTFQAVKDMVPGHAP